MSTVRDLPRLARNVIALRVHLASETHLHQRRYQADTDRWRCVACGIVTDPPLSRIVARWIVRRPALVRLVARLAQLQGVAAPTLSVEDRHAAEGARLFVDFIAKHPVREAPER